MGVKIAFVKKGQQGSPTAKYQEEGNLVHIEDKYKQKYKLPLQRKVNMDLQEGEYVSHQGNNIS